MSTKFKNLVGLKFSRWTVVERVKSRVSPGGFPKTFWLCLCDCGTEKEVGASNLQSGDTKSCGCWSQEVRRRKGAESRRWKGGRTKDKNGYVLLHKPTFPGQENYNNPHILEHIVFMARHLGRPLKKGETVHHKNGIRDDNRIENLELWASSHCPGQRTEDLVVWAKEILARYCPEALK